MCCAQRGQRGCEETSDTEPQNDPEASVEVSPNNSDSCALNNQYRYEGFFLDHHSITLQMSLL